MSGGRNESCDAGRSHNWLSGIGHGHFGVVLHAHNRQTHNKVVLKIIHCSLESKAAEGLATKTRSALKKMKHKNTVQCIDLWCGHLSKMQLKDVQKLVQTMPHNFQLPPSEQRIPVIFLELEFCEQNLRSYLKNTKDEWSRRFEIFTEIAVGLDYIHSQKVIHGGVKPENVLLTPSQQVKISDHGLAQFEVSTETTAQGMTSLYQPPELCAQSSSLWTESVDVFSLGIILFELMHLPCNQNGHHEKNDDPEFWTALNNSISKLTKDRQFPNEFVSDQYTKQLLLDITDKEVTKRPAVLRIIDLFDGSLRREVKGWERWSIELEETFVKGDLIEFNHSPCCHFAMYLGDSHIVHFSPQTEISKGDVNFEKFLPAKVAISNLKDVAGVCLIRLNNKPEVREKCRTPSSTEEVVKMLTSGGKVFAYSVAYLNAEHFVTFLKFDGVSFSSQVMNNRKVFCLIKMHQRKNPKDFEVFNKLAYDQWMENCKSDAKNPPQNVLEKGIHEWAHSI